MDEDEARSLSSDKQIFWLFLCAKNRAGHATGSAEGAAGGDADSHQGRGVPAKRLSTLWTGQG